MKEQKIIDSLNEHAPGFIKMLGGSVIELDLDAQTCTFEFFISEDFCHSGNIVQGGFITTMLDASMAHAALGTLGAANVSSLEINTSFLEATHPGRLVAIGHVLKAGYKTAFLQAYLYNEDGDLTATASSVAKLVRDK